MITTEYAALVRNSTPDNCLYVKRDGKIIGAVIKGYDGWAAYLVNDLLDLHNPVDGRRDLATKQDAIASVLAA